MSTDSAAEFERRLARLVLDLTNLSATVSGASLATARPEFWQGCADTAGHLQQEFLLLCAAAGGSQEDPSPRKPPSVDR